MGRGAAPEAAKSGNGGGNWMEFAKAAAMPLVTLAIGYYGYSVNASLNLRQAAESRVRLFTEMMSKREESDSNLRKEMFTSILGTFLKPGATEPPDQRLRREVMNLELVASNFDQSLVLGPLFMHVQRELDRETRVDRGLLDDLALRLERIVIDVKERQIAMLAAGGAVTKSEFNLEADFSEGASLWNFSKYAVQLPPGAKRGAATLCIPLMANSGTTHYRQFQVTMRDYQRSGRAVEMDLTVSKPLGKADCEKIPELQLDESRIDAEEHFWAKFFDFPMIDNAPLSEKERCAITVRFPRPGSVECQLAYFNASRTSLKDRFYYDEMLHDLVEAPRSSVSKVSQ